ncbi:alpha-ketoglutarate-dependent dioxygenase AlkB family protein [Solitalea lacus]|uniref:alpha-ketoglutarate-dependent dioxygenase AlkB family protein n=1 Tax=Solitalea lacus TaxID=2911172 RepID=UPI001ED9E984|nr:alpha-ketoglutarate-dependent dioxygenase AlkB [Solitalea lacus]UKJ06478.1 alpha-ketoglutarate-dependent dioxygenase AlkB [Solitalea lacus]
MDLFGNELTAETNLLPYDGEVNYYGRIMSRVQANAYFENLLHSIQWKNDEAIILGKHIITKRKAAWYGNEKYAYTYSNTTKQALAWTNELIELKNLVEETCNYNFNSCLLNLYHTGEEGMAWHSDDEKSLGVNTTIASLTLGAERKFSYKHKQTKQTVSLFLENGSLLIMKGATQTNWLHRLPPTKKVSLPRINLTFRTIIDQLI